MVQGKRKKLNSIQFSEKKGPNILSYNTKNWKKNRISDTTVTRCSNGVTRDPLSPSLIVSPVLAQISGKLSQHSGKIALNEHQLTSHCLRTFSREMIPVIPTRVPQTQSKHYGKSLTICPGKSQTRSWEGGSQGLPCPNHVIIWGIFPKETWGTVTRGSKKW